MPPKRSGGTKKNAGLAQPTLAFQARRAPGVSPRKPQAQAHAQEAPVRAKGQSQGQGRSRVTRQRENSDSPTPIDGDEVALISQAEGDEVLQPGPVRRGAGVQGQGQRQGKGKKADGHDDEDGQRQRHLDVKSAEVKALMREARKAMGGLEPIHAGPNTHDDVHHILRVFDMTSSFGPCVGITRLQRWERAKRWGLSPPDEIRDILTTVEGQTDASYRENVLHGWV